MNKRYLKVILYLIYLLVICETSLRVYLKYFAPEAIFKKFGSRNMLISHYGKPRLQPHDILFYTNTPNYRFEDNSHNSLGYRGGEIEVEKEKGKVRIICIGGSTTYSDGVKDYKESYPYILERELTESGVNAEVINAGTPGYYTIQNLQSYYLKLHDLQPDYVLIYQGINDLHGRLTWPPEYYKEDLSGTIVRPDNAKRSPLRFISILRIPLVFLDYWESESSLGGLVKIADSNVSQLYNEQLKNGTYPKGLFINVPVDSILKVNSPLFYKKNTEYLIKLIQENGSQPILTTFIYSSDFPDHAPYLRASAYQNALSEHNQIMVELSKKYDLELIDLASELSIDKDMFTDGVHFSRKGNEVRSKLINQKLLEIIKK